MHRAACTIISKNYLALARTLADSFQALHPETPFFVLLVDRLEGYFEPEREYFSLIDIEQLDIPDWESFCFKYNILELNTAVKPYFLTHLFDQYGIRKLLYFDPDILITAQVTQLFELLDTYAILLTPHITEPIEDSYKPGELELLQAGTYNLGFIGLVATPITYKLLRWWQKRVYEHCLMAPERGMHVDQKWMDLVPGLFGDCCIIRQPGYNVAYWNLHSRTVDFLDGRLTVNGEPGYFFHFSGFDPGNMAQVSKHQNRFTLHQLGQVARLFEYYRDLLLAHGYEQTKNWPYAFGTFDNGVTILDMVRRMYHALGAERHKFGNPFVTDSAQSFWRWLNAPTAQDPDSSISRLWYAVYQGRPDVQQAFPDVFGTHRTGFMHWIVAHGTKEYHVDERLVPHTTAALEATTPRSRDWRPFGVNLAGYFGSEKGIGEAARAASRSLAASSIPYVLNNVVDPGSANVDRAFSSFTAENPYCVNLIHVNADAMPLFATAQGEAYFSGRYNIGCWFWELAHFPQEWLGSFTPFDEIWAASSFIQDSLVRVSPVPVVRMPLALSLEPPLLQDCSRAAFGLPSDAFIFFFAFDFASILERKNPLGLIQAFHRAFDDHDNVLLLLKSVHAASYPREFDVLQTACARSNVKIFDRIISRAEMNTLLTISDCFISLHRSEGLGLTIAEAMLLEKPVIVTAYSGNMDFTTPASSFLVKYKLVEIDRDYGPYRQGWVWADPDLDHAAQLMRYVYANRDVRVETSRRAKQEILRLFHPTVAGKHMQERLRRMTYKDHT